MSQDRFGLSLATGSAAAVEAYVDGVDRLLAGHAGADDCFARALLADEGFALAHAGLGRSLAVRGLGAEARRRMAEARRRAEGVTARERQHMEAIAVSVEGDLRRGLELVEAHVAEFPRDAMVLSLATGVYSLIGLSGRQDRNEALLSLLDGLATHYGDDWWFLGAHAFAYTEAGRPEEGGRLARRSLDGYPRNAHAAHALAHVMYETGESAAGAAWVADWMRGYDRSAQLHGHLTWHRALFELTEGRIDRAWALYEDGIRPGVSLSAPLGGLADAASFLWRRDLDGDRRTRRAWPEVAEHASRAFPRAGLAFADAHCAMAAAAVGDEAAVERRVAEAREALAAGALPAGEVVPRLLEALGAVPRGDWSRVVECLEPVADQIVRVSGSLAQRDVFERTLLAAYLRAGRLEAAHAALRGRLASRPWAAAALARGGASC